MPAVPKSASPDSSLGPLLHTQRGPLLVPAGYLTAAVSCAVVAGVLYLRGSPVVGVLTLGVVASACLGHAVHACWRDGCNVTYVHQYGVRQWRLGTGDQVLRYADVGSVTLHQDVVFSCLQEKLLFAPAQAGAKTLTMTGVYFESLAPLENWRLTHPVEEVCRLAAREICRRWQRRLDRGEPVSWTESLSFQPKGLAYECPGTPAVLIPWDQMNFMEAADGGFRLWSHDDQDARLTLPLSTGNFWPGFFLLESKLAPRPPEPGKSPAAVANQTFQYTRTVEDYHVFWAHDARVARGRYRWLVSVGFGAMILSIPGVLFYQGSIGLLGLSLGIAGAAAAAWLVGWLIAALRDHSDRSRLTRAIQLADERARAGFGMSPLLPATICLTVQGCVVTAGEAASAYQWRELHATFSPENYIVVRRSAILSGRDSIAFYLPPRVFADSAHAFLVYHDLEKRIAQAKCKAAS